MDQNKFNFLKIGEQECFARFTDPHTGDFSLLIVNMTPIFLIQSLYIPQANKLHPQFIHDKSILHEALSIP
jgi:hypothetical protein